MRDWSNSFLRGFAKLNSVLDKPFFASEIGLSGGQINALVCYNIITWTWREKESVCHVVNDNETIEFRSYVKEWVVNKNNYERYKKYIIEKEIFEMKEMIALYENLK